MVARMSTDMVCLGLTIALLMAIGCTAPRQQAIVTDDDPSQKIPAITAAVQKKDLSAAKQLVADLDSDDAAVRFYAIQGLNRLTGQTFEYNYYDDDLKRQPALDRWKQWLAGQERK